jgi:hypothetical protein
MYSLEKNNIMYSYNLNGGARPPPPPNLPPPPPCPGKERRNCIYSKSCFWDYPGQQCKTK